MDYVDAAKSEARSRAYAARSRYANRWARFMLWAVAGIGLYAVWHERGLAPPVHDGMVRVAEVTTLAFEDVETSRGFVRSLFSGSNGMAGQGQYNAITQWLLDNRN